jgi:hypothetical protein
MDQGGSRRHLGAALLTISVLSAAGLAACSDDDPPPKSETTATSTGTPSSASPTTSPAPTPPTAPKAKPTPKSAEAFVKYFWDVYNYSYATLDSEPLRAMSKSTCGFCYGSINEIEKSKAERLTNEGGRLTPLAIAAPPGRIEGFVVVSSVLRQEAGRVLGPDQQIVNTSSPLNAVKAKTRLEWNSGKWTVAATNIERG